ncbi:MAG: Holliday junction branch migration DNA helicase RuvB [Planctomycetia bacterium]|nr:Holliday junction branch migration DNA helicase RuvB [Planctomycetia bacterium]
MRREDDVLFFVLPAARRLLPALVSLPAACAACRRLFCYSGHVNVCPLSLTEDALLAREPIIQAQAADEVSRRFDDDPEDRALRPQRMRDMVGQRDVCARLAIALDAAQKRRETLGHILFDGPPGLGKTTFATVIPRDLGVTLQIASGAALMAPKDVVPYLTNAEEGSVVFIDEIHRLPKAVEEFLYPAMEDFRIDITLGEGVNARTINMPLKPFTLIGATTRTGMLSAPLRDRFQLREHLDFYTVEELAEIVRRSAAKLRAEIDDAAATEIAIRSRGTPRLANNRLRWVRDYATSKADGRINHKLAQAALAMQEIDQRGLDSQDRKYLETIIRMFHGGPVGVEAIAHTMNAAADTLEDEVEPFLLRAGLVVRTPRGRKATAETYEHLGLVPPADGQSRLF